MHKDLILATIVSMTSTLFSGCADQAEVDVDTYTISRSGALYQEEQFDVVDVYGFSDNRAVAQEIADFLNESEPNTYQIRLNE